MTGLLLKLFALGFVDFLLKIRYLIHRTFLVCGSTSICRVKMWTQFFFHGLVFFMVSISYDKMYHTSHYDTLNYNYFLSFRILIIKSFLFVLNSKRLVIEKDLKNHANYFFSLSDCKCYFYKLIVQGTILIC